MLTEQERAELAEVLRQIGPLPGGVMHPDRPAERLADSEWFTETVARKGREAAREHNPDERIVAVRVKAARDEALAPVLALADEWDRLADLVEVPERGFTTSYDAANYTARTYREAASKVRAVVERASKP